jgi:two-component system OmpR family sensor kinase
MPVLKRAADDKDLLIEELRAAVRARDEFIAIAAHELRNPLTPVVMRLHSALRSARTLPNVPDVVRTRLEQTVEVMEHYVRRLDLLLDVSRITSNNLNLNMTNVDIGDMVRVVVDALKPIADFAGSPLLVSAESIIGCWDRLAVEQILQNLVSNAIKYGQGRPVTIAAHRDGAFASVEVRDEGVGISREDQERIFRAFERAAGSTGQGGFGVGLWVAHRLAEAMGGNIRVESTPGAGATFTVRLPRSGDKGEDTA